MTMNRYLECCCGIVFVGLSLFMAGAAKPSAGDALRVERLLDGIARQAHQPESQERRSEVSQQELNAYIAHRLTRENQPAVDSIRVDLLDDGRVNSVVRIDPRQLQLDALLGDALRFEIAAIMVSRDGAARLHLIALKLNGQPVKPQVLDFVIATVAYYYGWDWEGIEGWYALPAGVKRMIVLKDKVVLIH
jgi:hypothetical protein